MLRILHYTSKLIINMLALRTENVVNCDIFVQATTFLFLLWKRVVETNALDIV